MAYALDNLGYVALHQNNPQQAGALFRESLAFAWTLKFKRGITTSLMGLATVAAEMRRAERAAQLMGAAQAFIESAENQFKPLDLRAFEPPMDLTHAQLEDSAFDAAWSAGYAMPLDEVIEYASSEEMVN